MKKSFNERVFPFSYFSGVAAVDAVTLDRIDTFSICSTLVFTISLAQCFPYLRTLALGAQCFLWTLSLPSFIFVVVSYRLARLVTVKDADKVNIQDGTSVPTVPTSRTT